MPNASSGAALRAAAITWNPCVCTARAVASPIPEFPPISKIVFDMTESGSQSREVKIWKEKSCTDFKKS
jgi:hypothetical protein